METTTYDGPELIKDFPFTADVIGASTIIYSVLGVLIGLMALNLFYRLFVQGYFAFMRNRRVEPQVVEVVVNNDAESIIERKSNEKPIETKEQFEINELINHKSKK